MSRSLWRDKSLAFLFSHAFSSCKTMSLLSGKGKKSYFDTWTSMDEIPPLFKKLSSTATLDEIRDDEPKLIEFYVVRLYSKLATQKK